MLAASQLHAAETATEASVAWFTNAEIANSVQSAKPADALPEAPGTAGNGVLLTKPVGIENPLLQQECGLISFWIKPNWNGNDGKVHRFLRIGDPEKNGLLIEKSDKGMLRYVMASPRKITSARADVSHWKAGQWHQITVAWFSRNDKPLGLPLWIDKVAIDGPIASGNEFLDPAMMANKRIWIGDATSDAVMDELLFRSQLDRPRSWGLIETIYRDYFNTAPYTAIEIDPDSCQVPSDRRVVNGCPKQFGLKAKTPDKMERITENVEGYGNWTDFDAKPFIKWSISDEKIAIVDKNGMVTGKSVGKCKLTAMFRGMKASYDLSVIPIEQPDLDLYCVERLPRFSSESEQWWPDPGQNVQSVAHIVNYGYEIAPAGVLVRFELIPDTNGNFRLDADEKPISVQEHVIERALKPEEGENVSFSWKWTDDPVWVRVTVDPKEKVAELCEANNERCELNVARALRWGYKEKALTDGHKNKQINMVGSFSYFDWFNANAHRVTLMLQEAVYPTTSPIGIKDAIRTDNYFALATDNADEEPYGKEGKYYDGGFPVVSEEIENPLGIHSAMVHEFGHTCIALADLYGYPVAKDNVLLRDEHGKLYAGGELLPEVSGGNLMYPSAQNIPCGGKYTPLMEYCHMWLHPANAGQVQYFARYRGEKFWGVHGRLIPSLGHILKIYDVNDGPLTGAAVYVYHVFQGNVQDAGAKYFAGEPKFLGNTDLEGRYVFPSETDENWDDPDTDEFDGSIGVWNPFGRAETDTAFTPNVWSVEGLLLIKIVSGDRTEFHFLPLTELNEAFFSGQKICGTYPVRTSLPPSTGFTEVVKPKLSDAEKAKNLKPVAIAPEEVTAKCGEEFTIDGSKSYDPEGKPLIYRWGMEGEWLLTNLPKDAIFKSTASDEPGDIEYRFQVLDGLRVSDPVTITVHVE